MSWNPDTVTRIARSLADAGVSARVDQPATLDPILMLFDERGAELVAFTSSVGNDGQLKVRMLTRVAGGWTSTALKREG